MSKYQQCPPVLKIKNALASSGLFIEDFAAYPGEAWCIIGANRSGSDLFFKLLSAGQGCDHLGVNAEECLISSDIAVLSFARQQKIFEAELYKDDTDFLDRIDPGTPAREFIPDPHKHTALIEAFGLTPFLDQGYRELSTGQARKLLLLAECVRRPECLLLEEPYEGLDPGARTELDQCLRHLQHLGCCLLLFIANRVDVPDWSTHIAVLENNALVYQGRRQEFQAFNMDGVWQHAPDFKVDMESFDALGAAKGDSCCAQEGDFPVPLIELQHGFAAYRGVEVFRDLDLVIHAGEHTLVSGSNGSGKSTLLHLISGDHPACYQNELYLFGIKRGSGESIWELKERMGIVSPDLHRNYHIDTDVLSCVLSGLFDSIGVYKKAHTSQIHQALTWLKWIGLEHCKNKPFRSLSFADQRLALIARALIKGPELLIMDEPTQGLDEANRNAVLAFIEKIATEKVSTILYVSHRQDEYRSFFTRHIHMDDYTVPK